MARNERLADAIVRSGMTIQRLAEATGHHPKTVERWVSGQQAPYPRSRQLLSRALDLPEAVLFPEVSRTFSGSDELTTFYGTRAEVPTSLVSALANEATTRIDVCAYAATWLWDSIPGFVPLLRRRIDDGVTARLCLGDPDSDAVRVRGAEEGIGASLAARCRLGLSYARPLIEAFPSSVRMTGATLYASLYRFDDDVLANFHLFGNPASASPVLHCHKRGSSGIVANLERSFDAIWDQATPLG